MKNLKFSWIFGIVIFLAACTTEESGQGEMPEIIEAEILVSEDIETGNNQQLQVLVTQGDEPVEDASEVLFELWNDTEGTDSERAEAIHIGEGIYQIEEIFENTGVYSVQTHVTARGLHVMPKHQFHVGDVTDEQIEEAKENAKNQKSNHMDANEDKEHQH